MRVRIPWGWVGGPGGGGRKLDVYEAQTGVLRMLGARRLGYGVSKLGNCGVWELGNLAFLAIWKFARYRIGELEEGGD